MQLLAIRVRNFLVHHQLAEIFFLIAAQTKPSRELVQSAIGDSSFPVDNQLQIIGRAEFRFTREQPVAVGCVLFLMKKIVVVEILSVVEVIEKIWPGRIFDTSPTFLSVRRRGLNC